MRAIQRPILRQTPVSEGRTTRADVLSVLEPIWTAKSVTASRCRERIERLFAHATQNGHFHRDNPAAWRQFDATLPPPREPVRGHHAAVPHDDVAAFIAVRTKQPISTTALMLELVVLAACRTGEARFAVWSGIDLERNIWSVPAGRMKMRRDHVVPITGRMAEILAEARRRTNSCLPTPMASPCRKSQHSCSCGAWKASRTSPPTVCAPRLRVEPRPARTSLVN